MLTLKFRNGDRLPALGLGTWKSDPAEVRQAIRSAVQTGYRHIDCAAIYGNEATIGQAIAELISEGVVQRRDLWITSKLWCNCHGQTKVEPALRQSLKDLQLDYLDLYLVHWPITLKPDAVYPGSGDDFLPPGHIPLADTWKGMEAVLGKGLTRHIGVSNFTTGKLQRLMERSEVAPEMNQIEMHPLLAQNDMLSFCSEHDIHLTAYSPLGSRDRAPGMKGEHEPNMMENHVIKTVAHRHGVTPAQVLIAWALNRGTAVIPKSVNPGRIAENFAAKDIELTTLDMNEIAALDRNFRFLDGSIWAMAGSPYTLEFLWDE